MLPLARQGFTNAQVEAVLRSPHCNYGCRFELLDYDNNVVSKNYGNIISASVECDVDQKLTTSLQMQMLPDTRLLDSPFLYRIKPYFQVSGATLPEGVVLEFPMGVYVWNIPERSIDGGGAELWDVTLADQLHVLDAGGPGLGGFSAAKDSLQIDSIKRLLSLGHINDTTGVQYSASRFSGPRSWGLTRLRQGWGFMMLENDPEWQPGWGPFHWLDPTGNNDINSPGVIIQPGRTAPDVNYNQRTTTILDILREVHEGLSFQVPWFDANGRYSAKHVRDLSKPTADVTYGTAANGITISPIQTQNDLGKFCNRVAIWNEGADAAIFFVTLDANDVVPGHPLSQARLKFYADRFISRSTADSQQGAEMQARKELLDGLAVYQRAQWNTLAWPVHEPYDLCGLYVAGDQEFGTMQYFELRKYTFDLVSGQMQLVGNRIYPATNAGVRT